MLLSLGAASTLSESVKVEKNNETNTMESNGGTKGAYNKLIVIDRVIDCPHCGFPTTIYKNESVHYCEHCGRDINAPVQQYKQVICPWCKTSHKMKVGYDYSNDKCYYCSNYFSNVTEISLKATYRFLDESTPLIGNKAELYLVNSSGSQELIKTTNTDINGEVHFTLFPEDVTKPKEKNFIVRIYPGDDNITVLHNKLYNVPVQSNQRVAQLLEFIGGSRYLGCLDAINNSFVYGKKNIFKDVEITLNEYNPYSNDGYSYCFFAGQAALRAKEFAIKYGNISPDPVTILWDCKREGVSCYDTTNDTIKLVTDKWNANLDVVMHEYGHHLQRQLNSNSLLFGWGNHVYNEPSNRFIAWSEAWADTFPVVVQQCTDLVKRPYFDMSNDLEYGDEFFQCYNIESGGHNKEWVQNKFGSSSNAKKIEAVIAELLWDLFDCGESGDDYDPVSFSAKEWFRLTTIGGTDTIGDLYENFVEAHPGFENTLYRMFDERGLIY